MKEKSKGWQEEADSSELAMGKRGGRQASGGPGLLERKTTVNSATN